MTLLEVEHISKSYRQRRRGLRSRPPAFKAVDDVSFALAAGKTLALVGESGAGKTTIGSLVLRLIEPDSGSVRLGGTDVIGLSERDLRHERRRMQMIFQDPQSSFDPRISIGTSVAEPLKIQLGMNRSDRERRVERMLSMVRLNRDVIGKRPHELSGGQLQRASIARALTLEPVLLVCDEAVSALDVSVRAQVLTVLADLQAELQIAYLFISHDLLVVEALADEVAVMRHGRIVELGSRANIFDDPQETYTKELLSAILTPDIEGLRHVDRVQGDAPVEGEMDAGAAIEKAMHLG